METRSDATSFAGERVFASDAVPSLREARAIAEAGAGAYRRIPVKRELFADRFTPVEILRAVRAASNHCFLLESAEADRRWGRYSFIGFNPSVEITCRDGEMTITRDVERSPRIERRHVDHPADAVRELLAEGASPRLAGFPPFSGGLMGYFSYDYLKYAEPVLRRPGMGHSDFLDMDLMVFDTIIAVDSFTQKVQIIASVDADDVEGSYPRAIEEIDRVQVILESGIKHAFAPLRLERAVKPRFSEERYEFMVKNAQERIREGDIFQVVLSNPMTAPAAGSLFDVYRVLRCENPSPYMVFMTSDSVEIAAASPETLVKLEDGRLFTYPLAGTRPRGASREEDEAAERDLLSDEKELAEHNMLVDLGRNDIGRVAKLGSVEVERYLDVLRFSHVMHIGSTVCGELADGCDAMDVIDSILPAGTLSGAPKIRACQIIQDEEGEKRGIYGGAIGYIDFSGNLDTCIGIRLAYLKDGEVCVQSGAGIVADSVPEHEFVECRNKARAVIEALAEAEGGIR